MKDLIQTKLRNMDKAQRSAAINFIIRPLGMILSMIYTPLLLSYLGDEKYGLWSTILTTISWINTCDVGIGNGLRNLLSKELASKQLDEAKKSVSTAYIALTIIALVLLSISMVFVFSLNWFDMFNTSVNMKAPMAISVFFICVNFVLSLSSTILYAMQLSERTAYIGCIVQTLNIIGVLLLSAFTKHGNLIYMALLFGCTSMIIYIANSIKIFRSKPELLPRVGQFDKGKISEICRIGIKFFAIQLACHALYTVDSFLITGLYGGAAVTPFNIVNKAYSACYGFLGAIIAPYWSMTTAKIAQKNYQWVKKSMIQLNCFGVLFCFGYVLLAFMFKPLAAIWLGQALDYPHGLIAIMCIYYCVDSFVKISTQMINGTGFINCQLIVMAIIGVLNIPFSVFLAKYVGLGVVGIRLATTILLAIASAIFTIDFYGIIRRLEAENNKYGEGLL